MEFYKTITKSAEAEYKDKGSRFIARVFPINQPEDFKEQLNAIKKIHTKASHFCYAYRLGANGSVSKSGDDGEPSGSAGKPILGQLLSREVTNAAIVVVRYFGGTLLGVPGLIHAYKTAAALALQITPIEEKAIESIFNISCTYHDVNEVMRIVKMCNGNILTNTQGLFCELSVSIPVNRIQQAQLQFSSLYQVSFSPAVIR